MSECRRCGRCCKTINIKVAIQPEYMADVRDYAKYLTYYGCGVEINKGFLMVKIPKYCKHLTDNGCEIHDDPNRAEYCKRFFCDDAPTAKKRIFIAVPNTGTILAPLTLNLIAWSHSTAFTAQVYAPQNIVPMDAARNNCVEEFLKTKCDYLLWIDDDVLPPVNTIDRFLKADKDIIGAVCFSMKYEKGLGFTYPVTLRYDENKEYKVFYGGKGIEEVDATGGGCVMFKRKVYEAIGERPYVFHYHPNGSLKLTCDFEVFRKAQKAGFKLYIDYDILCDHVQDVSFIALQNTLAKEQANGRLSI